MKWCVLNLSDVSVCPDVFAPLAPFAEVVSLPPRRDLLLANLPVCDAYFCSLAVRIDRDALSRAPRLRVIVTPSTGLDHIDLDAARERGIPILSLKDDIDFLNQVTATAELAWGLLLATVRRIPWGFEAAKQGEWARDRFRGHQLSGMTLGVLGYGRLGRMVAEYGKAFRMRVLACDVKPDLRPASGVTMTDFDTLLRQSDVLSIHVHLTEENRNLIGRDALARMKPGAFLVNTSRGAIIDEAAFLDALTSGRLGGAGVDVIVGEWNESLRDHPLVRYAATHGNLVISPHVGGVTFESQRMAFEFCVAKLKAFLESHPHG